MKFQDKITPQDTENSILESMILNKLKSGHTKQSMLLALTHCIAWLATQDCERSATSKMKQLKAGIEKDLIYRLKELQTIKLCKADNNYNCPIWKSCPHGIDCALYNEDNE